jgi:hypothetical protein
MLDKGKNLLEKTVFKDFLYFFLHKKTNDLIENVPENSAWVKESSIFIFNR